MITIKLFQLFVATIHLDKITAPNQNTEDTDFEITLRPQVFADFVGQENLKKNLHVFISASKKRKEALEHVLLYGPPGLGKTTLAGIIANELGSGSLKITSAPALSKIGDIASLVTNLEEGDVLFIDEIHRLNNQLEEMLFSAMEDFAIDLMMGKGAGAKSMRLPLPKFTLIGATTRIGAISSPLRDRFGFLSKLEFYSEQEIEKIIKRSAKILDIEIEDTACADIAKCSRRTPRVANRLVKRMRDFAHHENSDKITTEITQNALSNLGIDKKGLDESDREFLLLIIEKFCGGPVGLSTLAAALAEEKETIEEILEPFLMQIGFLQRTPKGRMATNHAYDHLKIAMPKENKQQLF